MEDLPRAGDLVKVSWRDAWFVLDPPEDLEAIKLTETVGWVLRPWASGLLVIASEMTPDGPRGVTGIPWEIVHAVERLSP